MVGKFSLDDVKHLIVTGRTDSISSQKPKTQYLHWQPATCQTKEEYILQKWQWFVSPEEYSAVHEPLKEILQRNGMRYEVTNFDENTGHSLIYGEAYFDVDYKNIVLSAGAFGVENNILTLPTIAHEMGHWHDIEVLYKGDFEKHARELGTLEMEVRAWEFAVEYLKEAGYKHWEEFNVYMKLMLASYYDHQSWGFIRDRRFGFKGSTKRTYHQAISNIMDLV